MRFFAFLCAVALLLAQAAVVTAQLPEITIKVDHPGAAIPARLFGLFFEDIYFGADGGLYPAIHHYYGRGELAGDAMNLMARPLFYERFYERVEQLLRGAKPSDPPTINEWGLDLPLERQYSMEAALYGARLMNFFERQGGLVDMSAVSDLINGWPGGIIQAGRTGVSLSPLYLVNEVYNERRGREQRSAECLGYADQFARNVSSGEG